MKKILPLALVLLLLQETQAQNPMAVPPLLTGTVFNLNVQGGTTQFFPNINTPTYGVNGPLLGPTLILNKGDTVTLNVTNNLPSNMSTTMHWHGLHVPSQSDGGPHQLIANGSTWSPQFIVMNDAGTFWYHPHGEGQTDLQVSRGIAGMIIVRDNVESALPLPRSYGTDDFPVVIQTKSFDVLNQIAIASAYDTVSMVNGTVDPMLDAPAQVVRLRLLNGASERSFMIGFSNNMSFSLIGTDGGLLDTPVTMNRLLLANGERAEILVDLGAFLNDTIFLMNYGSELPKGVMGADSVGDAANQVMDYYMNPLNGADFSLLQLNVVAQTANPVTAIPSSLVSLNPWPAASAVNQRRLELDTLSTQFVTANPAEGPFGINRKSFHMDSINQVVYLNDIEIWKLVNRTMVAHPFHMHDIEFYVLDINGNPPPPHLAGKKDVILVMPGDSLRFITKFADFADPNVPYMYHCHLLHHEDEGMMGSFLVIDTVTGIQHTEASHALAVYPNPVGDRLRVRDETIDGPAEICLYNANGELVFRKTYTGLKSGEEIDLSAYTPGIYFLRVIADDRIYSVKIIRQ